MGIPSVQTRQTPLGIPLFDGHVTKVAFGHDLDISFWEKTVTPPGLDGGDLINITTMWNETWRTMIPRALITLSEFTLTAAYDPDVYDEIRDILNNNGEVTVLFPDLSTLSFWGALRVFEPQTHEEGTQPEANITIAPTNWDGTAEQAPVMDEVAGT